MYWVVLVPPAQGAWPAGSITSFYLGSIKGDWTSSHWRKLGFSAGFGLPSSLLMSHLLASRYASTSVNQLKRAAAIANFVW